jgi:hypothetical protein
MTTDDETPRNKVQRVIEDRELTGLGAELEQRWRGTGYEEHSTRELTAVFNRRVIEQAIRAASEVPLDGEVENFYRLFTDEDVRSGEATQARSRLAEYGIDTEQLEADLVSHQTIYRFLKNIREIDTSSEPKSTDELIESTRESLRKLSSRTQSVATQNLSQLGNREDFAIGDFDVFVNIRVTCNDCGVSGEITQIIDENGCDCR